MSLFADEEFQLLSGKDQAEVVYKEAFLSRDESDYYLKKINSETSWGERDKSSMFGNEFTFPRDTAWYGDKGASYVYSGIKNTPLPWTEALNQLKDKVESHTGEKFNSLLINRYLNGDDKVSWHSDDEPELGPNAIIASLSLGETRDFQLRPKDKSLETKTLPLVAGSLLVMRPPTQLFWEHQVPSRSASLGPRVNLTFRYVNTAS